MIMRMLWSRLVGLVLGRRLDREIESEIGFHLQMLIDENIKQGMNAEDARVAALRAFGGVTQMVESYREQRSLPWIEMFAQDARHGVRSLLRTPGFTIAALLTLALGIGANSAIFSVVNAVLLRPLPYAEPERIGQFVRFTRGGEITRFRGAEYLFYRDNLTSIEALAAWRDPTGYNLVVGDSAEFVRALPISKEFFSVFAVQPLYGGGFTEEEDRTGGPDVVVLGHTLWTRLFGANPSVVGTTVALGNRAYVVKGVMPERFASMPRADLYVPLRPGFTGPGGGQNYTVAARVKPGVSFAKATAETSAVFQAMLAANPDVDRNRIPNTTFSYGFVPFQTSISRSARPALLLMLGAVGMLLLIACANTANLLLARASGRGREIAVRAALGAARGRIVRQLLTESVLLFVAGGVMGLVLAAWTVPTLLSLTPAGYTLNQPVRIDWTVVSVMLAASTLCGLLFGLAPALSASRHDLVEAFKDDGTRTTGSRRSAWLRGTLVVSEVALCMLLLVGAGLLIQTFMKMRAIDPGFDVRAVMVAQMSLQGDRYETTADVSRFFEQALDRIQRIPGVEAAAVVNSIPIDQGLNLTVEILDGREKTEQPLTDWRYASRNYFAVMGIPIIAGRGFEERDRAGAPPVAVVSEEFARHFFKDTPAIGQRIRVFRTEAPIEIVGIARDVREQGLVGPLPSVMYVPVSQATFAGIAASHTYFPMNWVIRGNTSDVIRDIREAVRSIDPTLPFSTFRTMDEVKAAHTSDQQFHMTLLVGFAAIGLLLAAAGIYGLIAYSVTQRTREFGIRLALGATRERILVSVLRQGAIMSTAGVVIGTIAAVAFNRTLQNFVYGVSTLDLTTFIAVGALLIAVAVVASLVPALRAVRLNPVAALRE
jgi:predicted permease